MRTFSFPDLSHSTPGIPGRHRGRSQWRYHCHSLCAHTLLALVCVNTPSLPQPAYTHQHCHRHYPSCGGSATDPSSMGATIHHGSYRDCHSLCLVGLGSRVMGRAECQGVGVSKAACKHVSLQLPKQQHLGSTCQTALPDLHDCTSMHMTLIMLLAPGEVYYMITVRAIIQNCMHAIDWKGHHSSKVLCPMQHCTETALERIVIHRQMQRCCKRMHAYTFTSP